MKQDKRKQSMSEKLNRIKQKLIAKKLPARLIFMIMGIISTVWFLIRVIPKPTRAGYPCMRVAAPFMSSFVLYILSITGSLLAFKKARNLFLRTKYLMAGLLLLLGVVSGVLAITNNNNQTQANNFKSFNQDANKPMGNAKGINPGRVVWVWNPDATNENCTNTYSSGTEFNETDDDLYFCRKNNDQAVIDQMMADAVIKLAGNNSETEAWDTIFKYFNNEQGKGYVGYDTSEIVFIKINAGDMWVGTITPYGQSWGKARPDLQRLNSSPDIVQTTPFTVLAMIKQLVNKAGVPQNKIYVGDPLKNIYKDVYELWKNDFPDIHVLGNLIHYPDLDQDTLERTWLEETANEKIFYSDKGNQLSETSDKLYTIFEDAEYLINIAALKGHACAGVTLCAKNHFGSIAGDGANHLHDGLPATNDDNIVKPDYNTWYRVQVDMMGHELIGGKTILSMVDGLYSGQEGYTDANSVKWRMAPFNDDYPSSIFLSQDLVAIESVCFDFLRTEYDGTDGRTNRPNYDGIDDYMHQAADPDNWPSGFTYDPEDDGSPLTSLGAHEHWNNPTKKQYMRNIGADEGIELVSVPENLVKSNGNIIAFNTQTAPVIDADGSDNCWQDAEWNYIDQTWLPYAQEIDSTDFYGRFKASWSSANNVIYFYVETTDDYFDDGYTYPDNGYSNFDCVELFIDEDDSDGPHVFDGKLFPGMTACASCNAENAFSYHMLTDDPGNGSTTSSLTACDIAGSNWGTIRNYASHFDEFTMGRNGNKYTWEFALKVYSDAYDNGNPAASRVTLTDGKQMGFSLAYCDDDTPADGRDNFFGSVYVATEDSNNHWITADIFGKLTLQSMDQVTFDVDDGTSAINNASVIFNGEQKYTNASGQVVFDIMYGSYDYEITVNGADTATGTISVTADKTEEVSLNYFYTVTFAVSDNIGPLSNATVSINGQDLTTNSSGEATLDLINGTYDYTIEANGYTTVDSSLTLAGSNMTEAIELQLSTGICQNNKTIPFSVYPNPGDGIFNITIDQYIAGANNNIRVTNINGQVVKFLQDTKQLNKIDLTGEMPGLYIFELIVNNKTYKALIILNE